MHAPISIINPKARLYKRFTPALMQIYGNTGSEKETPASREIIYEKNLYRTFFSFRYEEVNDRTENDETSDGVISTDSSMTIKYNGKFNYHKRSPYEPEVSDLIAIQKEIWRIEGVQRIKKKTLNNFATIYLTLSRIL